MSPFLVNMCHFQRSQQSLKTRKKWLTSKFLHFCGRKENGEFKIFFLPSALIQTLSMVIVICYIYMKDLPLTRTDKTQSLWGGPGPPPCPGIGTYSERHVGQRHGQVDWQLGVQSSVHIKLSIEEATVVSMKWHQLSVWRSPLVIVHDSPAGRRGCCTPPCSPAAPRWAFPEVPPTPLTLQSHLTPQSHSQVGFPAL